MLKKLNKLVKNESIILFLISIFFLSSFLSLTGCSGGGGGSSDDSDETVTSISDQNGVVSLTTTGGEKKIMFCDTADSNAAMQNVSVSSYEKNGFLHFYADPKDSHFTYLRICNLDEIDDSLTIGMFSTNEEEYMSYQYTLQNFESTYLPEAIQTITFSEIDNFLKNNYPTIKAVSVFIDSSIENIEFSNIDIIETPFSDVLYLYAHPLDTQTSKLDNIIDLITPTEVYAADPFSITVFTIICAATIITEGILIGKEAIEATKQDISNMTPRISLQHPENFEEIEDMYAQEFSFEIQPSSDEGYASLELMIGENSNPFNQYLVDGSCLWKHSYDSSYGTDLLPSGIKVDDNDLLNLKKDTVYYWQVRIFTQNQPDGVYSDIRQFKYTGQTTSTKDPYKPQNPQPANNETNVPLNVTLRWDGGDPDSSSVGYWVYLTDIEPINPEYSDGKLNNQYLQDIAISEYYEATNLKPDTQYYWRIWAVDESNNAILSDLWTFTTQSIDSTNQPPKFTQGSFQPINHEKFVQPVGVKFQWDCSDPDNDPLEYQINIWENKDPEKNDPDWSKSDITSSQITPDFTFIAKTKYYWEIIARDLAADDTPIHSVKSDMRWFETEYGNNPPNTPDLIGPTGDNVPVDNVVLQWKGGDPINGKVKYLIEFSSKLVNDEPETDLNGWLWEKETDATDVPYALDIQLAPDTTYYWRVSAYGLETGHVVAGDVWSFTTSYGKSGAPFQPSNPSPEDESSDVAVDAVLEWDGGDPDGDMVEYVIKMQENEGIWEDIGSVDFPGNNKRVTYTPSNTLKPNTTYSWRIISEDKDDRILGPEWTFNTVNTTPIITITPNEVEPTWQNSNGGEWCWRVRGDFINPFSYPIEIVGFGYSSDLYGGNYWVEPACATNWLECDQTSIYMNSLRDCEFGDNNYIFNPSQSCYHYTGFCTDELQVENRNLYAYLWYKDYVGKIKLVSQKTTLLRCPDNENPPVFDGNVFENFEEGEGGFDCGWTYGGDGWVNNGEYIFDKIDSSENSNYFYLAWVDCSKTTRYTYYPPSGSSDYFDDFTISVDATFLDGESGALSFGYGIYVCMQGSDSAVDAVWFKLSRDEQFTISKTIDWGYEAIVDWTNTDSSTLLNSHKKNNLKIIKNGNNFIFFINNIEVHRQVIVGFPGGGIGITYSKKEKVAFDNFRVTSE